MMSAKGNGRGIPVADSSMEGLRDLAEGPHFQNCCQLPMWRVPEKGISSIARHHDLDLSFEGGCFISDNVDTSFISVWKESAPTDRSSYSRIDWALNLIFSRADRSGNRFDDRTMWFPALPSPLTLINRIISAYITVYVAQVLARKKESLIAKW